MTIESEEVLILDSSTFIREIGLMSTKGSALKHYLYSRRTQLVIPEVAATECERHLTKRAKDKIERIQNDLDWLAQFCNGINGWSAPGIDVIENQAEALAKGRHLGAVLLPEPEEIKKRAKRRCFDERPPAHIKKQFEDCKIWEHCVELLSKHDVIFVSDDKDFRSRGHEKSLHPQLRAEAEEAGAGRSLTFHTDMQSLLQDLKSEIPPIANAEVFQFIYEVNRDTIQELQSNSECRPTATGTIDQTRFATEARDVIEVRLEVEDKWVSLDGATSLKFELSGLCRYNLGTRQLAGLRTDIVRLRRTEPDGSTRSVEGSRVHLSARTYVGTPPLAPERGIL